MSGAANYDSVIDQLSGFGLVVTQGLDFGRIVRTKVVDERENRGWYSLHIITGDDGDPLIVGTYGVWRGNENNAQKITLKRGAVSKEKMEAISKRMAEDRKRAAADRKRRAAKAATRAASVWRKANATGNSEYLVRKCVLGHGLRYTESGAAIIPMLDAGGAVHGLQFILPPDHPHRVKTKRDKTYWPAGLVKKGHWFQIGSIRDVCLVAEGYATGATLHEATQQPVAVAFDANNLLPVGEAIKKANPKVKLLFCADDDHLTKGNPGITAATNSALACVGEWVQPVFAADRGRKKITDFNDLLEIEGQHVVRTQIDAKLATLGWDQTANRIQRAGLVTEGGGVGDMVPRISVDDAVDRYWGTYGMGGDMLFDEEERRIVHKKDVANLLPRHGIDDMRGHPDWRVARDNQIGFDPTEDDPQIRCNLFGGWPTEPKEGNCNRLLELLEYLCENENNGNEIYRWIIKWLAYPIQHRGAKMQSAVVVHGPQGTGKSRFFEAYGDIFGEYGRVLGQEALEDKFNADWSEKKLFILADEVLARSDMFHVKNRLKGFITGGTIRVNPKGIAAHNEKNQMNIVFLSNERHPLVLENDDRRHCVIWVPPKLPDEFFNEVNEEIENGGVAALQYYLLNLDLGDFKPWTKPPMTTAKQELIEHSAGSEERFIKEWVHLELESPSGEVLPLCPCLGSTLYQTYDAWCKSNGEFRPRPRNQFLGYLNKIQGWSAGKSERTKATLLKEAKNKNRKMVIPGDAAMNDAMKAAEPGSRQETCARRADDTKADWLTRCHFEFEQSVGNL